MCRNAAFYCWQGICQSLGPRSHFCKTIHACLRIHWNTQGNICRVEPYVTTMHAMAGNPMCLTSFQIRLMSEDLWSTRGGT